MRKAVLILICIATCALSQEATAAIKFKRFPQCADGLVTAKICECHKAGTRLFHYCHAGEYCHTFEGVCRQ
jgi:hypothetical protein